MKAANFDYRRVVSVEEAVALLADDELEARVLSGGQSLGPMMNLRLARPDLLVDISPIPELHEIAEDGAGVSIGALVTHARLEDNPEAGPLYAYLRAVAGGIAYRGVRNRGTIGGSLAHMDPAADWPTALMALGARVRVAGPAGRRELPIEAFLIAAFTTALDPGEFIVSLHLPRLSAAARWGYYKHSRKVGEFAEALGAAVEDPATGLCRVVAGALAVRPALLAVEGALSELRGAAGVERLCAALRREVPEIEAGLCRRHAVAVQRAVERCLNADEHAIGSGGR